jgi:hypothetical protein
VFLLNCFYRIHKDDEEVMENICALFCELSEYGEELI